MKGIVKWFNSEKGFGYISTEEGEDVFVHYKSIGDRIQILAEGEKVALEIEDSKRGKQARNVTRLHPSESIYSGVILFPEDQNKIDEAVSKYPMGSYHIGEIARISGLMYEQGIDVIQHLKYICEQFKVELK